MEFSDQQRLFLATICAYFHEKAEWPTYGFLDRRLKDHIDVREVGQELKPFMYGSPAFAPDSGFERKQKQMLSVEAVYTCQTEGIYPDLKEDLDAFMHVVRLLIEKYDAVEDDIEDPHVTSEEACEHFPMSELMLRKVYLLVESTNLVGQRETHGGDGNELFRWVVTAWYTVREYRGVTTLETYFARRQKLSEQAWAQTRGLVATPARMPWNTDILSTPEAQAGEAEDAVDGQDVFIVYGHDRGARFEAARYIEKQLGLRAIMLDEIPEAPSMGVFEAVERFAVSAGFAVVIMTPDDIGGVQGTDALHPRARQNVLIELGYFWHMLGRQRIVILKKGDVEIPSEFAGILYVEMDEPGAWRQQVRGKIQAAGLIG